MNKMKVVKVLFGLLTGIVSYAGSVCAEGFLTLPIESNVSPTHFFHEPGYETHEGTDYPVPEGSYIVAPCDADVEIIQDNVPHYDFDSGIKALSPKDAQKFFDKNLTKINQKLLTLVNYC